MLDKVFKALADKNPRRLLDVLFARNEQTRGELADPLEMSRQAVMKHLRLSEETGSITVVWQGREKLHSKYVSSVN